MINETRAELITELAAQGIRYTEEKINQLPDLLMKAVLQNNVVGTQGRNRPVFSVNFQGRTLFVAIQISTNGFIVGANPSSGG